jgi:hypothetical protein
MQNAHLVIIELHGTKLPLGVKDLTSLWMQQTTFFFNSTH